jgi:hypothetical protein
VVVQSSWTKLEVEDGSDLLRNVGPCPHDWLLPLCAGVVHHGGAGTVAAGLRFGLPTMVCPFFADQFMWGFFVEMAGVGPKATPVTKLTAAILAEKLTALASPELKTAAQELAEEMSLEDGIDGGFEHFMEWLPRDNMLCDISLILGETRHARYELIGTGLLYNGIKVGTEMAALLEVESGIDWKSFWSLCPSWNKLNHRYWYSAGIRRHPVTVFNLSGHIQYFHHGLFAGFWGLFIGILSALMEFFYTSDRFARSAGAFGCLFGMVASIYYVGLGMVTAVVVFFDRIALGISNGLFGTDYDYIFDPSWKARVNNTSLIEAEKDTYIKEGITKARRRELLKALDLVVNARQVFESANPSYPKQHRHFLVVSLSEIIEKIKLEANKSRLMATQREILAVIACLEAHARLAPPPPRRSTKFPALKSLLSTKIAKKLTTSLHRVKEEDSEALDESAALDSAHGDASTSYKKSTSGISDKAGAAVQNIVNKIHLPSFWHKKPEETEISFSMFLQALHTVCGEKCLHSSRRRNTIALPLSMARKLIPGPSGSDDVDEFSEYLT